MTSQECSNLTLPSLTALWNTCANSIFYYLAYNLITICILLRGGFFVSALFKDLTSARLVLPNLEGTPPPPSLLQPHQPLCKPEAQRRQLAPLLLKPWQRNMRVSVILCHPLDRVSDHELVSQTRRLLTF